MSFGFPTILAQSVASDVARRIDELGARITDLAADQKQLAELARAGEVTPPVTRLGIFHGYVGVLIVAFIITLAATPIMRRLAVRNGIIDRPSDPRKVHRMPIAYLGGVAVYLGIMAGVLFSFVATRTAELIDFEPTRNLINFHPSSPKNLVDGAVHAMVPLSILLGMTVIMVIGLIDDVMGISPRLKVGGQLLAAAALAIDDVGVKVAKGVLGPIGELFGNPDLIYNIPFSLHLGPLAFDSIPIDIVYWTGTAIIAIFVLGACNASNLIDGLDGLLTGTTAITNVGLLILALGLAALDDGPRDAQRIILCMAVLGACLGFLPHNFNPATIFLGDCGSLLLGFSTIVIILMMGDTGKTQLVIAGLIVYALPMIDTVLAIVRRKMAGKSISSADDQHLHHILKRALGVKGAVLSLYVISGAFATLGVLLSTGRARVIYVLAFIFASYIGVTAFKSARRKQIESEAAAFDAGRAGTPGAAPLIAAPPITPIHADPPAAEVPPAHPAIAAATPAEPR
ncbi:MAG: undecaprenyl/decaprenyl-phosphate alpha-N-acetylglucosaminyl 1-phosphate transferase [Phycisphaerales bacterium]|nr:undecaprenyl/decaprenyl-phosphate alpha-N-acetylglucosaminyl 1-phosphate transferase [Phycisphaerales bacterium]